MTDPRLSCLRERHAELDAAITEELSRPLPNFLRIRALKRRKLMLKQAIAQRSGGDPLSA
jgi:hypothetical protein